MGSEPAAAGPAYRELGRDLARLHTGLEQSEPLAELKIEELPEPETWPGELADRGYIGRGEHQWLAEWISRLRQRADAGPRPDAFRHGDLQATNVSVSHELEYVAVLDWGGCGWGDKAPRLSGGRAGKPDGIAQQCLDPLRRWVSGWACSECVPMANRPARLREVRAGRGSSGGPG